MLGADTARISADNAVLIASEDIVPNIVLLQDAICAGGNHLHVAATIPGVGVVARDLDLGELLKPLSPDEALGLLELLVRAYAVGKTPAQITSGLSAGVNTIL